MATSQLSASGFTPRTATEIKQEFVNELTLTNPEFIEQDADIQDCLLDTGIIPVMEMEKQVEIALNGYSPDYANDSIFLRFAESVGLRQKAAFNAQVMLRFSGKVGTLIPKNTEACDEGGNVVFKTSAYATINNLGYVDVLAYSENDSVVEADTITTLKSILTEGTTVTNPNASLAYIDEETLSELKERAQARFRSTCLGGRYYAISRLKSVEGVNQRLVAFYTTTIYNEENGINYASNGIEAVIGGGDDTEVGQVLYESFIETQKLVSNPSNDESERTITVNLYDANDAITIKYTRPKHIQLGLQMYISFINSISTSTSIEAMCQEAISDYVDNLQVGTSITAWSLNNIVVPILINNGIPSSNIATLRWCYNTTDDTNYVDFDSNNKVDIINKDCYCTLVEFGVSINQ